MDRNSRLWWNASRECISQKFGHWSSILPCLPVFLRSSFWVCLIKRWEKKRKKKNNKEKKRIRKPAHLRTEPGTPFSFANSPRISWRGRVTNDGQLMSLPPSGPSLFFPDVIILSSLERKKKTRKITIVFLFSFLLGFFIFDRCLDQFFFVCDFFTPPPFSDLYCYYFLLH